MFEMVWIISDSKDYLEVASNFWWREKQIILELLIFPLETEDGFYRSNFSLVVLIILLILKEIIRKSLSSLIN